MKLFLFFTIVVFLSIASYASPVSEFNLLTQDEFRKLDKQNKVEYFVEVQKILVQMSKKSPLVAGLEAKSNSRSPASAANSKSNTSSDWGPSTPDRSAPGQLRGADRTSAPVALASKDSAAEPATTDDEPRVPETKKERKTRPAKNTKNYRCMHSGWIIEGSKCQAPKQIPNWGFDGLIQKNITCETGLSLCNPLIFGVKLPESCENLDDCSLEAKAFCSVESLWPTEDCFKQANADNHKGTRVAVELQSRPQANNFLKDYQDKMNSLCNREKLNSNPYMTTKNGKPRSDKNKQAAIDDVMKTCAWAKVQVEELNARIKGSGKSEQNSLDSKKLPQQESQK